MAKKASPKQPKPKAKKQAANGATGNKPSKTKPSRGDNVVITLDDQLPFLQRLVGIKNEGIEAAKAVSDDMDAIKLEMATALDIPRRAVNDIWADYWARIRRERRQAKLEETNPDTALAYARCAKSLGLDTPLGEYMQERAREASEPTAEQAARDAEFEEADPKKQPPAAVEA